MESVIQKNKECYFCGNTQRLECHHIYPGNNRKASEHYGMKVWLCNKHHTGSNISVHHCTEMMLTLKIIGQRKFEEIYGDRDEFRRVFGRSYI